MVSRSFTITWLPVLATWAFLLAVVLGLFTDSPDPPRWPLVLMAYGVTSSILTRRLQVLLNRPAGDSALVAAGFQATLICLLVSTAAVVIAVLTRQAASLPATIVILVPLVIQAILSALIDASQEQNTIKASHRAQERHQSTILRAAWEKELRRLAANPQTTAALHAEIQRVEAILPYSSFCRSPTAASLLETIKTMDANPDLISTLRAIR